MKSLLNMAVVGTGMMADIRTRALLATNRVRLVGVASRTIENANRFALQHGCAFSTTDYRSLSQLQPDFLLVEVPHQAQSHVVSWALESKLHVLVGSCMATSIREIQAIREQASIKNLVVEAGFEARYSDLWCTAKSMFTTGRLGAVCAIQSVAFWPAPADKWYYSQAQSGGMPVTHMTYAFLNPLMWLFGLPRKVFASSNSLGQHVPGMVDQVTCSANLCFEREIVCSSLASYIKHPGTQTWDVMLHGTEGTLVLRPGELSGGELCLYPRLGSVERKDFTNSPDPFHTQAVQFVEAVSGGPNHLQNLPDQAANDVLVAESIVASIRESRVVELQSEVPNE